MSFDVSVGGVYRVVRRGGAFGVVKVLAHRADRSAVCVRTYRWRGRERPRLDWWNESSRGRHNEFLGIAIGALPVTERVFAFWEPAWL